ncbi:CsiV family protein [Thiomicrorhabdus sp.]|uniref:CsiV family protein n=1 Tax=Thiomicrorhabdus sp. TaxID=2039724 RepID=UPI002AA87BB9|nr:CsiV family protein [Thiomicrorhabdus sp.]
MKKLHKLHQSFLIKTQLIFLLTFAGLVATSSPAQAKEDTYSIEVVVFESLALKGWTEEYWPEDIEHPNIEGSTSVDTRGTKPLWINKSNRTLGGAVAKLNKRGYSVLFHQAWSQVTYANKNAPTVLIESDKSGTNMVGTVRLYKTRYAHVDIDLEFDRRIPSKILDSFLQNEKLLSTENPPTRWHFHLKESRKIKSGELHYIDHPLFGVLVKIHKIDN